MIRPSAAPGLPVSEVAYRKPDGTRGLPSLLVLTILSAAIGKWFVAHENLSGLDAFVIGMAWAIALPSCWRPPISSCANSEDHPSSRRWPSARRS